MSKSKRLSPEDYISKHCIDFYLEDAIKQMLLCKSDNVKVKPSSFFHHYFSSVKQGTHTLFREYGFIYATPWNRSSFIKLFWLSFKRFLTEGDLLSAKDYHSLLCLLSSDFQLKLLHKTINIILLDDATDCVMSFTDFIYAFQLQFYYDEFTIKCHELFKKLQESSDKKSKDPDSIQSIDLLHAIKKDIYEKNEEFSLPPEDVVSNTISTSKDITFYGFLMALSRNDDICKSIGALPTKLKVTTAHVALK